MPQPGEFVANTTEAFDAIVAGSRVGTLFYAGYAANTDMLFGVGGTCRGPFKSTPKGGQFDFVWLPARTPHGAHV